jgi:hypothetical protein
VCKVLNRMKEREYSSVVPVPDGTLRERPLLDLSSGYIQRSIQEFPRAGHRSPWRVRQNYILDAATTMRTDLDRTLRPARRAKPENADNAGNGGNGRNGGTAKKAGVGS